MPPIPRQKPSRTKFEKRQHPRAPLLTQVEAQGERAVTLGRATDISIGGLLIDTPETLEVGIAVVVRFFLPSARVPLEVAGRVVRCDPGKSMAIAFLGLPDSHRRNILDYVESLHGKPSPTWLCEPEGQARRRRSARLPRRVSVVLSWQDEQRRCRQEAAETQQLSRYGALLLAFSELKPGNLVRMSVPDTGKEGLSRVVYAAAAEVPGRVEMGMEVMGKDNLWGIDFPEERSEGPDRPGTGRRRSGRLPRRLDVVLNWVDESGRVREEQGQTSTLSRHGASVSSPIALPPKQRLRLQVPALGRAGESQVVWSQPGQGPDQPTLGIEFLTTEDFWGMAFPPAPGSPKPD